VQTKSGTESYRIGERSQRLMKNVKVSWTDLLLLHVVLVSLQTECNFKHPSCY